MLKPTLLPLFAAGLLTALALLGACTSGSGGGISPATPPEPPAAQEGEDGVMIGESDETEDEAEGEGAKGEEAETEAGGGETGGETREEARPGRARTAQERAEAVEKKLQESLSEFDRKMLEEQETLARQRTSASAAAGGAGAETGSGSASAKPTAGVGSETSQTSEGRADGGGTGAREPGEPVADESNDAATRARTPPDIPDGRDDDIVARQLREAAIEEDDPRLRERLWDEYRRYKGLPVKGDRKGTETEEEEDPGDRQDP